MVRMRRLSNPLLSMPDARRWASSSLPRLIVLAIGIHMFFSLIMMSELHIHHQVFKKHYLEGMTRPRLHPQNAIIRQHQAKEITSHDEISLEVDDLYVGHLQHINKELQKALNISNSVSCRWRSNSNSVFEEDCDYHTTNNNNLGKRRIALFNPLEQERILCDGTRIGPAGILVLKEGSLSCSEPPRLFSKVPTLHTKEEMDPIELTFQLRMTRNNYPLPLFPCDVPCKSDNPLGVISNRLVKGTPFQLQHSMEGAQYYRSLLVNPAAHRHYQYYSTTSFQSEIPLPYFSFDEYGTKIQGPAVKYDEAIKGAVFIARNCNSRNNREGLVKSIIDSGFRVDSVSKCLNNAEPPNGATEKKDIMKQYLFYLAFENQCETDYVTEKLWQTFHSGTLPVYYGAPNIEDHVPPNSIINAHKFNTSQELAEYLQLVASNRALYESYHAWRTQPLPESFVTRYNMTRTHSTCRTCRWAAAKKYGLGWNHTSQTLEDLQIPRKVCSDARGVLTHPFREAWLSGNDKRSALRLMQDKQQSTKQTASCRSQVTKSSAFIRFGNHHVLKRTVRFQDGVTDIHLEASKATKEADESLILQMSTTIDAEVNDAKSLKALSVRHYRFQDATKRMTILSSRSLTANVTGFGVLELHIPHVRLATEIRVIVEDIEPYNDSKRRTNYFGQVMTEDFLNPLEKFVVWGGPANESVWAGKTMDTLGIISPEEEDDDKDKDGKDDIEREEEERREAIRKETEEIRKSMIEVKDPAKQAAELRALSGVKKLIEMGIIPVRKDDEDEDESPAEKVKEQRPDIRQKYL